MRHYMMSHTKSRYTRARKIRNASNRSARISPHSEQEPRGSPSRLWSPCSSSSSSNGEKLSASNSNPQVAVWVSYVGTLMGRDSE
jgi:hypothetical protein